VNPFNDPLKGQALGRSETGGSLKSSPDLGRGMKIASDDATTNQAFRLSAAREFLLSL